MCEQNFGYNEPYPLSEMTLFKFSVGGYFGTSQFILIDGKRKNKLIRYAETSGGMFVDLKHPKSDVNLNPDILLKEIPLSSEQWFDFIKALTTLEISCWKDKYYDNDICDGTQWNLKISFSDSNKISKCGSNEYPPYWNKFKKIMGKFIGESIC
ncbi:hypothetical protein KPL37_12885 [Clostridium frigoris]|uniref:Uncharacterized protein n=1 Tax=Clostridium frigoris TaxID=205327 RepID=A0ABS6BUP6_9CLOT|nr:hypothetical protein [Clostridium frigoris]